MKKAEVIAWIASQYGVQPEALWENFPDYLIFRNPAGKWFAVLMKIDAGKLSLKSSGMVEILNVKCQPDFLLAHLGHEQNIFPAYHMNKKHWCSILLNENINSAVVAKLLQNSFELTLGKSKLHRTEIIRADRSCLKNLLNLALELWPQNKQDDLYFELASILAQESAAFFLLRIQGEDVGFAQCQLRQDYVEGTSSSPVGYLEGVFIRRQYRGKGYGKKLLGACEKWAAACGCTEFASDCELPNKASEAFHKACGFQEANRIICFTKKIRQG